MPTTIDEVFQPLQARHSCPRDVRWESGLELLCAALSLAQRGQSKHFGGVKTLAIEDIYADPHTLDSFLAAGVPVVMVRSGQAVADLVPKPAAPTVMRLSARPDFKARFVQMWGPDAFNNQDSAAMQFAEFRSDRRP